MPPTMAFPEVGITRVVSMPAVVVLPAPGRGRPDGGSRLPQRATEICIQGEDALVVIGMLDRYVGEFDEVGERQGSLLLGGRPGGLPGEAGRLVRQGGQPGGGGGRAG